MQPKLYVIHLLLLVPVLLVSLTIFSHVLTSSTTTTTATATSETTNMKLEYRDIRQELEPIETEEIKDEEEDNMAKQEDEGEKEEEQENNYDDDTAETGLEEGDIMIEDNNYSSDGDDDVPLELPFDNPIPFP